MQQTTLPHRVARSAKDLASATLPGATFELKDPRDSKYAGTSSRASTSFEHLSRGSAQPRPGIYARGSSFRDETDDVQWRKAEEDFERFQQLDDFQSEFTACLSSLNDTFKPHGNSYDPHGAANEFVTPAEAIRINADESTSRYESISESIPEGSLDSARTAAVRRLNQIGAHLQRNLAMQALNQEAYLQSHASMNDTRSLLMDELTRQADNDVRNTTRTNEKEPSYHGVHNPVAPQHQGTVVNVESPPKSSSEQEEDVLQRQFHCPYYACHRNLKLQSTSSSNSNHRQCVHVGCDLTLETFSSWAEHIHMPHHDLLGSV